MSSLDRRLDAWLSAVAGVTREVLRDAPEEVQAIRRRHGATPEVALIGPFNAGKSSLLKRLCIDDELPIPDGLLIQAEPSTASVERVEIGRWVVIDTPGLDSEHPDHVELATRTACDADRVLLLLTHELFSERSATGCLLAELEPGTVDVVLSRIDKAVMSPDSPALAEWVRPKAESARQRAASLGHHEIRVFAVAADVRGRVGNRSVDSSRFDGTRKWDGVAELRSLLDASPGLEERRRTTVRRGRSLLRRALDELSSRRTEAEAQASGLARDADETNGRIARVRELEGEARATLKSLVIAAARRGPAANARPRIVIAADEELDRLRRRLNELARESSLDEPSWSVDLSIARDVPVLPSEDGVVASGLNFAAAEAKLRERLAGAGGDPARLRKLEQDLADWKAAKRKGGLRGWYAEKDTAFDGIQDVRGTREELSALRRREGAVRAGEAFLDAFNEERTIRAQQRQRDLADQVARNQSEALAVTVSGLLHDGVGGVRKSFEELIDQLQDRCVGLEAQDSQLKADVDDVRALEARVDALAAGPG